MTTGWRARPSVTLLRLVLIIAVSLAVCVAASTSGCSKETESLVGTWTSAGQGETLDFRADGTLFFTRSDGKVDALEWQADDRSVAIGVRGDGTRTCGYSIKDGVLTLTYPDEESAQYQRVHLEGD